MKQYESVMLNAVKQLVKARLYMCKHKLFKNTGKTDTSEDCVVFKDKTHYSRKAADAMERIADVKTFDEFDWLMFMQAIKACINKKVIVNNQLINSADSEIVLDYLLEVQLMYFQKQISAAEANTINKFIKNDNIC